MPSQETLKKPPKGYNIAKTAKNFNLLSSEWSVFDNGNNNCTAVVAGQNALYEYGPGYVLAGQAFYQGLYVDHNYLKYGTLGFAELVNQVNSGM